jgi:tetratricopeptide (TPR) repeat protein
LKGINSVDSAKLPNDIDKALEFFKEANKLAPDFADVHYYLGKTLAMLQGNTRNAVNELKKYLTLYPDAPDKENVEADLKRLEDDLKSNRKSSLMGVKLMSLSDGVYIRGLDKSIHRISSRFQVLHEGDKILKVNEDEITGLTLQQVLNKIDSESSDKIKLTIQRTDKPVEVTVSKSLNDKLQSFTLKQLGEDDLSVIIKESDYLMILWGSSNCSTCLKYYSTFNEIIPGYDGRLKSLEVDLDENKMIDYEYNINKAEIPVVTIYKDGKQVEIITGFNPDFLKEKIEVIMK